MERSRVPTQPGRAGVYLLVRRDRLRFKLGWSFSPIDRAMQLVEYKRRQLDLAESRQIWLPTRGRAEQIERSLHKSLAPYRVGPGHRQDGHREWFAGRAQFTALDLLARMPLEEESLYTARMLPLTAEPRLLRPTSEGEGPQAVYWRIEDLLERLVVLCRLSVSWQDSPVVQIKGLRQRLDHEAAPLRSAALDADTYQSWTDGRPNNFVQTLHWSGDDLVLSFMPWRQIERWEDGPELVWQLKALLTRLHRMGMAPRGS